MTIPTSDFSNVYNKDFLKKFYPQIVDELYTNSIISQFLHELDPAFDVNKVAKQPTWSLGKYKGSIPTGSVDGVMRITWGVPFGDRMKILISLERFVVTDDSIPAATIARNRYLKKFTDNFEFTFYVVDEALRGDTRIDFSTVKKPVTVHAHTGYDSGEFEDFVLNDLVRPVNTKSNILLQIASYKYCYNALKDAFFREFK